MCFLFTRINSCYGLLNICSEIPFCTLSLKALKKSGADVVCRIHFVCCDNYYRVLFRYFSYNCFV